MRGYGGVFLLAVFLAIANPAMPEPRTGVPETAFEGLEQQILSLVNRQRQLQKLPPLNGKGAIAAPCRQHSRNMALGLVPAGHQGIEDRIRAIQPAVTVLTYSENVAVSRGYKDPALDAVEGWMKSPGHRKAILGDFNLTGIGVAMSSDSTFYFTQIFIRSR